MDIKVVILLSTLFVYSASRAVRDDPAYNEDLKYLEDLLDGIPEEDRRQFLIHQLYLGYVLTHPNDVVIPVSQNVTMKLYDMFLRNFIKSPVDKQLLSIVCFPSGECVDTDDPGVVP